MESKEKFANTYLSITYATILSNNDYEVKRQQKIQEERVMEKTKSLMKQQQHLFEQKNQFEENQRKFEQQREEINQQSSHNNNQKGGQQNGNIDNLNITPIKGIFI